VTIITHPEKNGVKRAVLFAWTGAARRSHEKRAYEMGAGIAANPHYPVLFRAPRPASSRSASLAISSPQNDALRCTPAQSGDGLVGPRSGAGLT